ncbi:MAG: hypothetical protein EXQ63_01990 [Ilumatobacteraceae bacterium]|nr:hypothetical protein [Ilumatobacteraceae bacterium]
MKRIIISTIALSVLAACGGSSSSSVPDEIATTTPILVAPEATTVADNLALGRPVIMAHASGENVHPHSTPYGYAEAVKDGVDILDFDVQLTKDGVLVVQHNLDVDAGTDGTGNVIDITYDQVLALDNAYWFTKDCTCKDKPAADYIFRGVRTAKIVPPRGYTAEDFIIPKFIDIATKYPQYMLNIEIKDVFPAAIPAAKELARILQEIGANDRAVVTSFDDKVIDEFRKLAPTVELSPGRANLVNWFVNKIPIPHGMRILQIPTAEPAVKFELNAEFVARAHAEGFILWIWPSDSKWENTAGYTELLNLKIDGINAANPAQAMTALDAFVASQSQS